MEFPCGARATLPGTVINSRNTASEEELTLGDLFRLLRHKTSSRPRPLAPVWLLQGERVWRLSRRQSRTPPLMSKAWSQSFQDPQFPHL